MQCAGTFGKLAAGMALLILLHTAAAAAEPDGGDTHR
jgi:hypothetical protein